jgi:hypothetical protein
MNILLLVARSLLYLSCGCLLGGWFLKFGSELTYLSNLGGIAALSAAILIVRLRFRNNYTRWKALVFASSALSILNFCSPIIHRN